MTIETREPARGLPRFLKVMSAIHGPSRGDALTVAVRLKPTGRDSARVPASRQRRLTRKRLAAGAGTFALLWGQA
jgi:hypothetical protein